MSFVRSAIAHVLPDAATNLYDVRRLAELFDVSPSTIRSWRYRNKLPEPTATNINGGAVWEKSVIERLLEPEKPLQVIYSVDSRLPTVVDLFAGCGGMSLGFQRAGFDVLEGFDNWQCAVDTYTANLGHPATLLDLGDLETTVSELERFHTSGSFPALIGGPPCQDFSSAGNRVEGARADLTEKFAHLVEIFQPPFFVMENVARAEHAAAFQQAVASATRAGYAVRKIVLDASKCGVPQVRKRLITIGTKSEDMSDMILGRLQSQQTSEPMSLRDWFGERLDTDLYYRHPRSYARRGVFSVDEPSPTIRGVNRPIPGGYPGHPGDAGPISDARPLTFQERAEIQTFPSDFKFIGARTNIEQMIGNAVPVRLAEYVANEIAVCLTREGLSAH